MQCAAVISKFSPGLLTTLAVQKCDPSVPLAFLLNSAPTAAVPLNGMPRLPAASPAAWGSGVSTYAPSAASMVAANHAVRRMVQTPPGRTATRSRPAPRRIQSLHPQVGHPRSGARGICHAFSRLWRPHAIRARGAGWEDAEATLNAIGPARALASCADRSPTGRAARYPRRAVAACQPRLAHDPCGRRALQCGGSDSRLTSPGPYSTPIDVALSKISATYCYALADD